MIAKRLEDITVIDLQELIDNEVGESRTIEYKSELHFEKGDERREFLADVTSFANTDGGDLIYGIREDAESNLPIKLVGIAVDNEDDLIRKIESLLRDSISPRIPEIGFHMVSLACETSILIIRIGISFLSPHRVIYKGYDKFFARHAKGKYQMDVMELRSAFTMAQTLTKEIDQYKTSRLKTIFENKYQELSDGYPIFVMQSIPISSFRKNRLYSVKEVSDAVSKANAMAFGRSNTRQVTIDGVRITSKDEYGSEFAHFITNGIIEMATTSLFYPKFEHRNRNPKLIENVIYPSAFIETTCNTFDQVKAYYGLLDINQPLLLACAILKGKGFCFPTKFGSSLRSGAIDRNELMFPDVIVEDISLSSAQILKPIFVSLWNACGYLSCPAYNANGDFVGIKSD